MLRTEEKQKTPLKGGVGVIADTPYAGMTRIRLKGRCGITHPLSPLARTPLDKQLFNYGKYSVPQLKKQRKDLTQRRKEAKVQRKDKDGEFGFSSHLGA